MRCTSQHNATRQDRLLSIMPSSEFNLTATLFNTIDFVEDSTGMIALLQRDDNWEWCMSHSLLRVVFRSTTLGRIDETKRQSVTNTLKEQGWEVFWSDEDEDEDEGDDDEYEPLELHISASLESIYYEVESFLKGRVPPGSTVPKESPMYKA